MGDDARQPDPKELAQAQEITVPAFAWGETLHPSGDFAVTPEFYEKYRKGFEALREHKYFAPVLRQHKDDGKGKEARKGEAADPRELEDGFIFGKLVDVLKDDEGIKHKLAVPAEVKEAYDKGYIDEWSPSFRQDWPHPHTGEVLELAPRHHAFVSNPHQKNLGPSSDFYRDYYDLAEAQVCGGLIHENEETMSTESQETTETQEPVDNAEGEEMGAKLDQLLDLVGQLLANQDATEAMEGEDEEVEMGEEVDALQTELAEAKQTIRKMRNERVRDRIKDAGIDDDKADELVELSEADPAEFAARFAIELAEVKPKQPTRLPEKGGQGSADVPTKADPSMSVGDALELAESELKTTDEWKEADAKERSRMKVRKSRELRGEV